MGAVRIACISTCVALLTACAGVERLSKDEYAELDVALTPGCNEPSAAFRELRDEQSRAVRAKSTPLRVPAGVYSIGVSCGSVFNSDLGACVDQREQNPESDVPPYNLVLKPGIRYVFSCNLRKDQPVVRLVESAL